MREKERRSEKEKSKHYVRSNEKYCNGVIMNPLYEQVVVYVVFCMYKIARITKRRKKRRRRRERKQRWNGTVRAVRRGRKWGGGGIAALVQCAQVRERRGSLVKRRNNLPV